VNEEQVAGGQEQGARLEETATVRSWVDGLREQWGEEPADMSARIETLAQFCRLVERAPDAIIAECVREVEGGMRIRIKKRRFYSEMIDEFEASLDGDARTRARAGNVVRSFMIHNGIFMQGGVTG